MPTPTIADIQAQVCRRYKLPLDTMTSPSRVREHARPRQVAMTLSRSLTNHTRPMIGRRFGGRHPTTVLWAERQITHLRTQDPNFDVEVCEIESSLILPVDDVDGETSPLVADVGKGA